MAAAAASWRNGARAWHGGSMAASASYLRSGTRARALAPHTRCANGSGNNGAGGMAKSGWRIS